MHDIFNTVSYFCKVKMWLELGVGTQFSSYKTTFGQTYRKDQA